MESTPETDELWRQFHDTGDQRARDELIEIHMPLVYKTARAFPNVRAQDREDLVGAGALGLIRAIDEWDPARMSWPKFVRFKVKTACIDHIRACSWVGKSYRREVRRLEEASAALEARNAGRPPTEAELAAYLDMDGDELAALRSKTQGVEWNVRSLDVSPVEGEGAWGESIPDPAASVEEEVDQRERLRALASVLERLPARQRDILTRRYLRGESQKSIAHSYGFHESRVSQILDDALEMARRLAFERPLVLQEAL